MKSILLLLALLPLQEEEPKAGWQVRIESPQKGYVPGGEPFRLRFTVENPTEEPMDLAVPKDYTEGLEVRDPEGRVAKPFGKTRDFRRVLRAEGRGFLGQTVDVSRVLDVPPEKEGEYTLRWKFGTAVSESVRVFVMREYAAVIRTSRGDITIRFYPDLAPNHVKNFVDLARAGEYEGSRFHRVIPGFMMQGGAPADPAKVPKKTLDAEFSAKHHGFGTVSMARGQDPNSATTQFFICFGRQPHLDGKYTVFGQVIDGEDVVKEIEGVRTDHDPCKGCGAQLPAQVCPQHCGRPGHHADEPLSAVYIKKVLVKPAGKGSEEKE